MERLDFSESMKYNAVEASIHMSRYIAAKPYVKGMNVLDVACGEGYGTSQLKKWGANSVVGVDISDMALEMARKIFSTAEIEFVKHSAEELPFNDNSFDVVVSFETIEHLDNPESFLKEIKRVLKPNGTVLLSCPNDPYYAENDEAFCNPYHKKRYNWFEFKALAESILGQANEWYFGTALNGFMNLPLSQCVLPDGRKQLPHSMFEMLDYNELQIGLQVSADRYVNYWNSCYYMGVWGENCLGNGTAVAFPRETYSKAEDPQAYIQIQHWIEQEREECLYKLKKSELERERTAHLLLLAEKEKAHLWGRIGDLQSEVDYLHFLQGSKAYKLIMKFWRLKDRIKKIFK